MLYEGGIREPLIVRWPGHTDPGTTNDTPVIGTDFYPTLLEIGGADVPAGKLLDGMSFVSLFGSGGGTTDALSDRSLVWHFPAYLGPDASVLGPWRTTPASAIRRGDHKLIHYFEDDRWELYNLSIDIAESDNLMDLEPEIAAELQARLRTWLEETDAFIPSEPNPEFDATLRAAAEAGSLPN